MFFSGVNHQGNQRTWPFFSGSYFTTQDKMNAMSMLLQHGHIHTLKVFITILLLLLLKMQIFQESPLFQSQTHILLGRIRFNRQKGLNFFIYCVCIVCGLKKMICLNNCILSCIDCSIRKAFYSTFLCVLIFFQNTGRQLCFTCFLLLIPTSIYPTF